MVTNIILRATPSAAGPPYLETSSESSCDSKATKSSNCKVGVASGAAEHPFQHVIFFYPQMPFGKLCAFFLTFRNLIFAPREQLGELF